MVQKKENQKAASSEQRAQFRKSNFVQDKNPQKLEASYLVQFFSPISNILVTVFKIQRSPNALQISFFFKTFTYNFFLFIDLYSNCRKFHQESLNLS